MRDSRRGGFTLVEVVVVMALMALMTAVAVPAFRGLSPDNALTGVAEEWASVLRHARTTALTRSIPVMVLLDPESGGYWIESGDSLARGRIVLGPEVTLTESDERLRWMFDRTGGGAGSGAVATFRSAAEARVVGTDPWTGEIHVRIP